MTLIPSDGDIRLTAKPWTSLRESKQNRTYILKTQNNFTVIKKVMMLQMFIYKYELYTCYQKNLKSLIINGFLNL
jgi:hypothetical protein